MRIAFAICRQPEYRLYAPVIEAALAKGWDVECWHDYAQSRTGPKGYQFPDIETAPIFQNGRPLFRSYQAKSEVRAWLSALSVDAVVGGKPDTFGLPLPTPRPLCVLQQYNIDSLFKFAPDVLLAWDVLALHSRWWLDWSAMHLSAEGLLQDSQSYARDALSQAAFVGLPELDAATAIDRDEVRRRWGIGRDQPVVVLFPFPQGVGRGAFWPKRIYAEPSRLKQLVAMVAYRRFEYWQAVWHRWSDPAFMTELRRFCDRNGAYLIVKSRQKTPVPAYAAALADRCVYDESFYPATVLETLSIANLSIGYFSNSVFESVALGVPSLCVTYTAEDYNGAPASQFPQYYSAVEGGVFQFTGVSTAWSIPETIARLGSLTFDDLAMDPAARERYIEKFLTAATGGGIRTVDAIEQAMHRTGRLARSQSA